MKDIETAIRKSFSKSGNGLLEIPFTSAFSSSGEKIYIDKVTGLVRSELKYSEKEIVDYWSKIVFNSENPMDYTAENPFAQARILYVILTLKKFLQTNESIKNSNLQLCDFATGEGKLLKLAKKHFSEVSLSGTEASTGLVKSLKKEGFLIYNRMLGNNNEKINNIDFKRPNIGTLTWTLCNCIDPLSVLMDVNNSIEEGGYLCVAESSRIMVPFRKNIHDYLGGEHPNDMHPFHFSVNTLSNLLILAGFEPVFYNRYADTDVLLIIAKKTTNGDKKNFVSLDNPKNVMNFFTKWLEVSNFILSIDK